MNYQEKCSCCGDGAICFVSIDDKSQWPSCLICYFWLKANLKGDADPDSYVLPPEFTLNKLPPFARTKSADLQKVVSR